MFVHERQMNGHPTKQAVPYATSGHLLTSQPLDIFRAFHGLVTPGVIGNYTGCEIYSLFFQRKTIPNSTFNLFTLVHFCELSAKDLTQKNKYLNKKRILQNIAGEQYTVGIQYYARSLTDFAMFYRRFLRKKVWDLSGQILNQETSSTMPRQYVPADGTFYPALNKVLKNNFFGGSYLIEHFDEGKKSNAIWLQHHDALSLISGEIGKYVPIRIASVSDRLGGIVLQFPIQLVRSSFIGSRDERSTDVTCKIDPAFSNNQPLQVVSLREGDRGKYLHGFGSAAIDPPGGSVRVDNAIGIGRHFLVDPQHNLILGSFYGTELNTIAGTINMQLPESRLVDTSFGTKQIQLVTQSQLLVGRESGRSVTTWEGDRIFDAEKRDLERDLAFIQYGIASNDRSKALADIEKLVRKHGDHGVWLWDPYLTAQDLINTLFLSPCYGTPLRALTSSLAAGKQTSLSAWMVQESSTLASLAQETKFGINLDFLVQHGNSGWRFHDRFLLFPKKEQRPRVWSLGTSVNSLGTQHHILQEVSHPAHMIRAFEELWNSLDVSTCRVWKS